MDPKNNFFEVLGLAKSIQVNNEVHKYPQAFSKRLQPILDFPKSKPFLINLLDVAFRTNNLAVSAGFVKKIFHSNIDNWIIFSAVERQLIRIFQLLGYRFPSISIPLMQHKIAEITQSVVFVKGSEHFKKLVKDRTKQNVKLNINLIGEALLGEMEANERLEKYKLLLNDPDVNYVSVKISTIYSQIDSLAYDHTLNILVDRLSILYNHLLKIFQKTGVWKFINLDMEEYRDMSLTVDAFIQTLSKHEFSSFCAGIVLQAYIPDSYKYLLDLQQFAQERVKNGGAPIKIRIVKGANMEMEKVEASLHGWPLVTYSQKIQTDANYKKMLQALLTPQSCESIKVGVASHNVFELAYAVSIVKQRNLASSVDFEMLEGMAQALVFELLNLHVQVLLYTPLVEEENFLNAIAYLVRRLDEGTASGNFLKEGLGLHPDHPQWRSLESTFMASVEMIPQVSNEPNRKQNRNNEEYQKQEIGFVNVPDTDWVLEQNRTWIHEIVKNWKNTDNVLGKSVIPISITKQQLFTISQNNYQGKMPWLYQLADVHDYKYILNSYKKSSWYTFSVYERINLLRNVAVSLQKYRGDLIGIGLAEAGKLVKELDAEVSEAVDFANYYAHSMTELLLVNQTTYAQGGINLVLSPWNFPIAIPAGGVLASLVTGNVVVLKPSLNTAACAYVLCQALWEAGMPKDALYFMPCEENVLDMYLSSGNTFDAVILTGSTDTAQFLLKRNPELKLFAETGGKNATIVTALADREQAIKNIIHSAFSNSGQKCSATSLLVLEKEVFDDENFKKALKDAVESKKVGSPWDMSTQIGPLIQLPNEHVLKVLTVNEDERWLITPTLNEYQMYPGVLWGVDPHDLAFQHELFAPILSVICANDLAHAVDIVNSTKFGLTSGIETLDADEIEFWKQNIIAGNLYINRSTTGAIVQRQPFGGLKMSSFGQGLKAGGPNYITQFLRPQLSELSVEKEHELKYLQKVSKCFKDAEKSELQFAIQDFEIQNELLFSKEQEMGNVRGQSNVFKYLKPFKIVVTVDEETSFKELCLIYLAAITLKVPLQVLHVNKIKFLDELNLLNIEVYRLSTWNELVGELHDNFKYRIMNKSINELEQIKKIQKPNVYFNYKSPVAIGRFELLNYLSEQSISHNYHRYGNLMGKDVD